MKKAVLFTFVVLLLATPAWAQEGQFPVAAYSAPELEKVQQWEAQWAGKKIDKKNIDQVADFLPDTLIKLYKDQTTWQAPGDGFYFVVTPYKRVVETQGMIAATRENAPRVKLNDTGLIENYADLSGMPFPNPQNGLEVAWNYDFNTRGDSSQYRRYTPTIEVKLHAERPQDADCWELFFAHRVDRDPKPRLSDNPKGIHWAGFYHMYKPNEYANTRRYNLRYLDPARSDDQWMYNSSTRRLSRISATQRTDYVEGSIVIYDDEFCWNGQISSNNYRLSGTRELLSPRHTDIAKLERRDGQTLFNNLGRERIKTLVVDVVSKDKQYVYGKRVWYVDPETYIILATEIYDRKGQLWKYIEQFTQDIKTESGEMKNYVVGCHVIDLERVWAAVSTQAVRGVGIEVSPDMFSASNLQKAY
jgi:hypothetical protein